MMRVPFSFDTPHGMVTIHGTVSLEADALVIETRRMLLDLVAHGRDTFRLPVGEIASIEVERGVVSRKLVIEPFTSDWLDGFPSEPDAGLALELPIKRKHCDQAEALAREARRRNLPL